MYKAEKEQGFRVVIIDDHPMMRRGLWDCLIDTGRFFIAGEAESLEAGRILMENIKLPPDLVVLDIGLGEENGLDFIGVLKNVCAARNMAVPPVLIYSVFEDPFRVQAAVEMGIRGYVSKSAGEAELIRAIDRVLSGERFLEGKFETMPQSEGDYGLFTRREREILMMVKQQHIPTSATGSRACHFILGRIWNMIKRNEEFNKIVDIMVQFDGKPRPVRTPNRGLTEGGFLVHVLIIGNQHQAGRGITNSHGPGIAWDEIYMDSKNGGLTPAHDPQKQAMFIKNEEVESRERRYTFRGIYEIDTACSTEFRVIFRRIATEVDETLDEWRIVKYRGFPKTSVFGKATNELPRPEGRGIRFFFEKSVVG